MTFRVSLFLRPHLAPGGTIDSFIALARHADEAGVYSIEFGDHLVMGPNVDRFPYGTFAHPPTTPWMDPLTTLAAVSSVTSDLRLSTGVLLVPLRPATVLAKAVATLDVLSGGRVELGVGTGWQREEYDATGVAWKDRYRRFDEVVTACRILWGEDPKRLATSSGLGDVVGFPRPLQARVPLFYGVAATRRHATRIARLGDGWCPVNLGPAEIVEGRREIQRAFADVGRDPATLVTRVMLPTVLDVDGDVDFAGTFAPIGDYVESGVDIISVSPVNRIADVDAGRRLIDAVVTRSRV